MTLTEGLLIMLALAFVVFAVAEYEGANMKVLTAKKLLCVCLIFFLEQMIALGLGYALTRLPFIAKEKLAGTYTEETAVLYLIIGLWLSYRTWKWKQKEERLRELQYRRIALEALMVALYTFLAGIGCGLMTANLGEAFLIIFLSTILAVIVGLYTGYSQGDRFHRLGYGVSALLFIVTGIRVIVRYIY